MRPTLRLLPAWPAWPRSGHTPVVPSSSLTRTVWALLLSVLSLGSALAQTPAIEFAPGAGNPTTNGPSVTDQIITYQNNTNNPTGNTFAAFTPTTTVTYNLSGQQYNNVTSVSTNTGTSFGTTISNTANAAGAALFPTMQGVFGTTYANNTYTSSPNVTAGTGIDITANSAVGLYNSVNALQGQGKTASTTRFSYSTLTITFSQPIVNPVIQIVDLGGNTGNVGFTTDLDLLTSGVTLSKLSGSAGLAVSATRINNSNGTLSGTNFVSGSVQVTTPTTGVTSLQFQLYIHGDNTGNWPVAGANQAGDVFYIGVSAQTPQADIVTTLANVTGASVQAGSPITYTATAQNNGPTLANNVAPQVQLPAGLTAAAFTSLPTGASYNNISGVLTLPSSSLVSGASASYNFTFTAPNFTTTVTGVASSTSTTPDPTVANNNGSAASAQVSTTVTLPDNGCAGTAYPGAGGSGLYAEYYKGYFNDALNYFSANTPGITRTDGTVNFPADNSWGNLLLPAGNPVATGTVDNPDTYSARYRGAISIPATGSYTFYLTSDDASYMWIDGAALAATPTLASALINNSGAHSAVMVQATITLTAGQHNILIFYGENTGDNILKFEYSGGPGNITRQIVPNSVLCPTQAPTSDLATIITGPQTAVVGQTVYYQATTTNLGTDATTNVVPTITLANKPAAGTVSVTNGTYDPSTGIVTFNSVPSLAANASVVNTVSFVAQASPATATGKAASSSLNSYDPVASNNDGSAANANVTTTLSPTGAAGTPANCATAGKDGAAPSLTTSPNAYYPSTGAQTLAVNATTITVGGARGAAINVAPGDLLLIIQTQGADINATNTDSYGDGVAGGSANGTGVTTNFTAGTYEYVTVASTSATVAAGTGGTITLATGLKNSYSNAVATATTGQRSFQVIRVPQYTNVTLGANIVPTPWNGSTGGIVAIDVDGQLNLNGFTIDASGMGFRGGAGRRLGGDNTGTTGTDYRSSASQNTGGTKGEGIAGTPRYVNDPAYATANSGVLLDTRTSVTGYPAILPGTLADGYPSGDNGRGAPGNAGGGGTDADPTANDQNTGGGGGANGGRAGRGGNSWNSNQPVGGEPGAAFPAASSSRLVLGGGGGAGSTNDGTGTPGSGFASSGAAGGGIVLVRTGTLTGTGSILANGANANNTVANDGSGGGGAGGSILVTVTNSQSATLTLTANGGTGGTNTGAGVSHGPGGGGGGGVIFTNSTVAATATANGASNGTTVPGTIAYGAESGTIGVSNAAISNSIANSTAGANCIADVATTITGPASAPAGSTVSLSATFSNIGAQPAAGVTRTVTFPANTLLFAPTSTGGTVTGSVLSGYTITYPATSLASQASNTYTINYTAPGSGPVVATSNIATTTGEGGLTANNTSSISTAVGLIADVTTALTGPQTVSPGQPTGTYTASFTNEGPSTASAVTRTVTLPAGATNIFVNGVAYTPATANTIDFGTAATLASGASNAFTFSFTPATSASGTVAITSNVGTATSQGNDTAPNASTLTATVAPVVDVTTTITATTASVAAGTPTGTPRFTVTFSNTVAGSTAAGVAATVQLPAGLTNVAFPSGTAGSYNATTGLVTYASVTSLTNGTPVTSVITFDAPATGPVVATSAVTTTTSEAGQTTNNKATTSMAITPAFDLMTTLSGPASAVPGSQVLLAVTTTNSSTSPSAAAATETLTLTPGLTNVYVSNGGVYNPATTTQSIVSNGVTYSVPAGSVVFPTIASLPAGQTVANSVSYTQPATAFAPSALVSTSTSGETNTANNTAYLNGAASSTTLANATAGAGTANVYTSIVTSTASTTVGSSVTLTVTTGNNGPNAATGVQQTVQILPGLQGSISIGGSTSSTTSGNVVTVTNGSASGATYNLLTGIVTFPALTNGSTGSASATSVSNTISFLAPATTGNNGQLLAMAAVTSTNTDPVLADNVASVAITLLQSADMIAAISGPATSLPGQPVQYTASFVNKGPMTATSVTETAQLPAGLGTVSITDPATGTTISGASYNNTTGLVTFPTLTTDLAGASQAFNLSFTAPAQSLLVSTSVATATPDAVPTNNSASVATAIASADLATTVAGPPTAVVGNAVTYTVNTTNNGLSTAPNAATTLQLAAGFSATTLQVNGQTGTLSGTVITYTFSSGATATYNTTTGLVTFPTVASLANGASVANYVTFVMPSPTGGQTTGIASASSSLTDPTPTNNTSSVATSIAPATTTTADLVATVSAGSSTATVGSSIVFTASYSNNGPDPATNVVPTLQLLPGLTTTTLALTGATGTASGSTISFSNGASYNQTTGLLTFATIASQASGAAATTYTATVTAPANGPVVATAATTSATTEPNTAAAQANDVSSVPVTITPSFDEITTLVGPASAAVGNAATYTVTAINNGPSLTSNVTTQTVTLPAGVAPLTGSISIGGTYSSTTNTITWTIPAGQGIGNAGAVANSFTLTQPSGGVTVTASVSVSGESNTNNNSANLNGASSPTATTVANQAPLAFAVVNSLQNPQSNDAGGLATGLLISPLAASDPENSFAAARYTVVAIPTAATQGTLYYNNSGTYTAVTAGQTLTNAQSQTLRFKAVAGFVGNASFTYLTTDAAGSSSPAVSYTIPVEPDTEAATYTLTPTTNKGGSGTPYKTGDVIAYTTDVNGAVNNASTGLVYQTDGTPQPGSNITSGIASATAGTFTSTRTGVNSLADLGLTLQADGRIVVTNPGTAASPNLRSGTYSVAVTTVDANGGVTTQTVNFTIPSNPLPVVLTAFTASAVQNRDTKLSWTTASEINSAYFDVERSLDGSTFTKIGQVAAQGTVTVATNYAFTDLNAARLAQGPVYYRLKQVDLDAKASYSPVRSVSFTKAGTVALSLYPNPAQASTTLDLSQLPTTGTYQVQLLDATGRLVRSASLGGGLAQSLDLHELATGTYHVLVTGTLADGSALRQTLRLTKE